MDDVASRISRKQRVRQMQREAQPDTRTETPTISREAVSGYLPRVTPRAPKRRARR